MKRILVPIDFSETSIDALNSAYTLATKSNAEILLLHVVEDPFQQSFNTMGVADYAPEDNVYLIRLLERTKVRMEELVQDEKYKNIKLRYKIEVGQPFAKISDIINHEKSSLVIMGSTGASGLSGLILGSNTDKVVKFAACPVITIKKECDLSIVTNLVFATDMKPEQTQMITIIKEIQHFYQAKIHLVKIFNSEWTSPEDVEARLENFASKHELQNYTVVAIREANEVEAIIAYANEIGAQMIAMGTHHGRGLESLLGGFVSKRMVNTSPIPLLTKAMM